MDAEEILALSAIIGAVAAILPLALTHGMHQAQEVSEAWRKLADRHRLQFNSGARVVSKTSVAGVLGGREFLLARAGSGNNQTVCMELTLNGPLPAGLRIQAKKPSAEGLAAALEWSARAGEHAEDSDAAVDEKLKLRADDAEELPAYMTHQRMKAAVILAEIGGELEHHKLRVPVTKEAADLETLDRSLGALARMAPVLDTA